MLKRIVTIQDISCFGKCSLTVALPILSAMGIETAIIPTAVLSTHTGGFTGYTFRDLTEDIPTIAKHWNDLQLKFDGIYTGYLGSKEQVQIVSDFFDTFHGENTKIIVDPVMGDAGKLYAGFEDAFVAEMRKLCAKADIIVPNMTEASFLLNRPYTTNYTEEDVKKILRELTEIGASTAILTGVQYGDGLHGTVAYHRSTNTFFQAFRSHINQSMHGTGDVFSSVLSGALTRGADLQVALQMAVDFTVNCIEATIPDKETYWYGVSFESCLGKIAQEAANLD